VAGDETVYQMSPMKRAFMLLAPLLILAVLLWTTADSGADLGAALERSPIGFPILILGSLLGFIGYRLAHTILLHDTDATVEFRTFLGTRVVPVRNIASISPSFFQGQLVIKHVNGSVTMPAQFAGCHDLVEWIRKRNPEVVLKGI